jgi:hypothetical protein
MTYLLVAAMVVAPFLALLYDLNAGLGVMAAALIATAIVTLDASRVAEPPLRRRLLLLAWVNGGLGLLGAGLLAGRLLGTF